MSTVDVARLCMDDDDASVRRSPEQRFARMQQGEEIAGTGSWEWDLVTSDLVWSDNLYRLHGLHPRELTLTTDYLLSLTHPDDRDRMARRVRSAGRDRHSQPVEYRIIRPDGVTRWLRSTLTGARPDHGRPGAIGGVVEDITDEMTADHSIAAHLAASEAIHAWRSLDSGALRLLGDLAGAMEFHAATLWVPASDELVARAVWTDAALDAADFASQTRALRLRRGSRLPGMVWQLGHAINVTDVDEHPAYSRGTAALRAGLRSAVAVPASHDDEVIAVLELNSREAAALSPRLMLSLRAIGSELGQFLVHRRGELDPIRLTARQLEILELAARGCTGGQIAERLCIGNTTVKSHFAAIYARLGVSDRAAAVAAAMRYGLIK